MRSGSKSQANLLRAPFSNPVIEDIAIALIVTAVALISLSTAAGSEAGFRDNDLVGVLLVLLSTLPLAARRLAPLSVLIAIEISLQTHNALGYAPIQTLFFASLIAIYSAALYTTGLRSIFSLLIALGGVTIFFITTLGVFLTGEIISTYLQWSAVWLLGLIHRLSRERLARMEERNALLEGNSDLRSRDRLEQDRRRITRELHDGVGHALNVAVILAGAAQRVFDSQPEKAKESLASIESASREALTETERMLGILQQTEDEALLVSGLGVGMIADLAARVTAAGLPVQVVTKGQPRNLPPDIDYATYRIIQESLTNCLKYAGDAQAQVTIDYNLAGLDLNIIDYSETKARQDSTQRGTGLGIRGMEARVNRFGGKLNAGSRTEGGFQVHAWLPFDEGLS